MTEKVITKQIDKDRGISYEYALCLVDVSNLGTRTFSYKIPDSMKNDVKLGQAVSVPFGNRKQNITAFIVGFSNYVEPEIRIKEITRITDKTPVFSLEYLNLLDFVANYYCCDINTVLQAAIPMKYLKENPAQKEKTEKYIEFKSKEGEKSRRLEILNLLEQSGKMPLIEFEKKAKTTRATVLKLQESGLVNITEERTDRNPVKIFGEIKKDEFPELSDEQNRVFNEISKRIDENKYSSVLLKGVTGSGKTEIYFKAIKKVLSKGKNVLFLAPEIALASQLTVRILRRFDENEVAIWHSSISDGEKFDVWNNIRAGKIRIIIGARSAVFAPLNNIGLVIIDEEHENTYKQVSPAPRYDARLVAEKICKNSDAVLIKGSATPDVSSYFEALSTNSLLTLEKRFNNVDLAKVTVIDMKEEFFKGSSPVFSNLLINSTIEALDNKKQVIYLINRRGFHTSVRCRSCGEQIKCDACDIPLVYHASDKTLKCHWCGKSIEVPKKCPSCGSEEIKMTGAGSQRIEDITRKLFPNAKVDRIDSDVLNSKTKYIEVLEKFQNGQTDILIGTQMIAKGLDNKNVTLVGVIDADINFAFPDFRSAERGFRLLMQAAGRAGRGNDKGKVIFQTFNPDLYAVENAKTQNYEDFYNNEIKRREMFDYPPFCQIIKAVYSGTNEDRVFKCANEIYLKLSDTVSKLNLTEYLEINPAMPCIIPKINSEYRYQIIIKNKLNKKGQYIISKFFKNLKCAPDIKQVIDIDPADII